MPKAARSPHVVAKTLATEIGEKEKDAHGVGRNHLKRLIPLEEMQENPSLFSWKHLAEAWAGLAGF
jgi:hypothetical protein